MFCTRNKPAFSKLKSYLMPSTSTPPGNIVSWIEEEYSKFDFKYINDSEQDTKEEQYGQVLLPKAYCDKYIKTDADIFGQFLHMSFHNLCDIYWMSCKVPMCSFSPLELDFIEEIYNQALCSKIAPELEDVFPRHIRYFRTYRNSKHTLDTMFLDTLLEEKAIYGDEGEEPPLHISYIKAIHFQLRSSNPLDVQTFENYMIMWRSILDTMPEVRSLVNDQWLIEA